MARHPRPRATPLVALALALLLVAPAALPAAEAAAPGFGELPPYSFRELPGPPAEAEPPIPPFPVQLVQDDDSVEGAFGVSGATSRPFLWFQIFEAPTRDFDLEEIWVLFPSDPQLPPGSEVQLVVYRDTDADPSTGAILLGTYDVTVQATDGNTFSIYPLAPALPFNAGGQIYLGVVSRYAEGGTTPPSQPAALDTTSSFGRSWVATWTGDPPDPPMLPPDQSLFRIDNLVEGNWMIRGFGTATTIAEVPSLDGWSLGLLALLLLAAGWRWARLG